MPLAGASVAITIANNTDQPLFLQNSSTQNGEFIAAPRAVLAPFQSEIVTAHSYDPSGVGVYVTYSLRDGPQAVLAANGYEDAANLDGTYISGNAGRWGIDRSLATEYPAVNAAFTIYRA